MKPATIIITAKKFLFDTWYGAFAVWCGVSALLAAVLLLDLFFTCRIWSSIEPYVGFSLLSLLLIAGIVFIAAWIVSLVKRRWKRAIVQLVLGGIWTGGLICAVVLLSFAKMFGPSEDSGGLGQAKASLPPLARRDLHRPCGNIYEHTLIFEGMWYNIRPEEKNERRQIQNTCYKPWLDFDESQPF